VDEPVCGERQRPGEFRGISRPLIFCGVGTEHTQLKRAPCINVGMVKESIQSVALSIVLPFENEATLVLRISRPAVEVVVTNIAVDPIIEAGPNHQAPLFSEDFENCRCIQQRVLTVSQEYDAPMR